MYRRCFLCGRSETNSNRLEVHHIFGGANRKLSDRYGQAKAMSEQGWDEDEFREIFGKNYL